MEQNNFTEDDLQRLIVEKIELCNIESICTLAQTDTGKIRIIERVKQIIYNDGITDIDAALGLIDEELNWEK
jgi:hypothetical protein